MPVFFQPPNAVSDPEIRPFYAQDHQLILLVLLRAYKDCKKQWVQVLRHLDVWASTLTPRLVDKGMERRKARGVEMNLFQKANL